MHCLWNMKQSQNQMKRFLDFFKAIKCICYPFWAWWNDRDDFRDPVSFTPTFEIPALSYTWCLKKVPLSNGASQYRPL